MMMVLLSIQEMSEQLGIRLLNEKRIDPSMQDSFEYFFPKYNPKNTRFSINGTTGNVVKCNNKNLG